MATGERLIPTHRVYRSTVLFICVAAAAFSIRAQGSISGHWEGAMVRDGARLAVSFDLKEDDGLKATFNSPTQRATGIPIKNATFAPPRIHMELVGDTTTIVFDGEVKGDAITGQFRENEAAGTFSLRRVPGAAPVFKQEEVSFRNGDVTLSGTLILPLSAGPHPAVVFMHGSGDEGRYASRFLAEYLATSGIAALIYDKRGVGKSTGSWHTSDFSDLAGDALAAVALLKTLREIAPRKIGLYGHSQGGMIGPLAASRSADVAFVISGAGNAIPVYEGEVFSLVNQLRSKGIAGDELDRATAFIKLLVDVLRTGKGWDDFNAAVEKARDTKWYPMLHVPARDNWFWAYYQKIGNYNAAEHWAKVRVPALVIYGERDELVSVARSISNIGRALNKAENGDYTILMLPRAGHAFNIEPEPGQPFEWSHLSPGFPALLAAWINQRFR